MPFVDRHICVHRIPLHVRDDAYAPHQVRNDGEETSVSEKTKVKYFRGSVLKRSSPLIPLGNFQFARKPFWRRKPVLVCYVGKIEPGIAARRANQFASKTMCGCKAQYLVSICTAADCGQREEPQREKIWPAIPGGGVSMMPTATSLMSHKPTFDYARNTQPRFPPG